VNLEDISQPNCFKFSMSSRGMRDSLCARRCAGTGCVTLAGLINALKSPARTREGENGFLRRGRIQHDQLRG